MHVDATRSGIARLLDQEPAPRLATRGRSYVNPVLTFNPDLVTIYIPYLAISAGWGARQRRRHGLTEITNRPVTCGSLKAINPSPKQGRTTRPSSSDVNFSAVIFCSLNS